MEHSTAFETDAITKKPIDEQVQQTFAFVQQHEALLDKINEANNQFVLHEKYQSTDYSIIGFVPESIERVIASDIIPKSTNENLKKIFMALTFLTDEMKELKNIAETQYFRPLIMFGQMPIEIPMDYLDGFNIHAKSSANQDNLDDIFSLVYYIVQDSTALGNKEQMIGKSLYFFTNLMHFVNRIYSVIRNLIQQISSLYNKDYSLYINFFQSTHFIHIFQSIGELLNILYSLDCIIQQNDSLIDSWTQFKSMIAFVRQDFVNPEQSPSAASNKFTELLSNQDFNNLELLIFSLNQKIFSNEIFQGCIEQNYEEIPNEDDSNPDFISIRNNSIMLDLMIQSIKTSLESIVPLINSTHEYNEKSLLVAQLCNYALIKQLLPPNTPLDAKFHKVLVNIHKSLPLIMLQDTILIDVGELLIRHVLPNNSNKPLLEPSTSLTICKQYLTTNIDTNFATKAQMLIIQCKAWILLTESRIQRYHHPSHSTTGNEGQENPGSAAYPILSNLFDVTSNLLIKGLSLMKRVNNLIKSTVFFHTHLRIPLNKSLVTELSYLIEIMRAVELTFQRKESVIAEHLPHLINFYNTKLFNIVHTVTAKLENILFMANNSQRSTNRSKVTLLYHTLLALENVLKTSQSFPSLRQCLLNVLMEIFFSVFTAASSATATSSNTFFFPGINSLSVSNSGLPNNLKLSEKESNKLMTFYNKLLFLSNYHQEKKAAGDVSYLYFSTTILFPTMVSNIYEQNEMGANRLLYLMDTFQASGLSLFPYIIHYTHVPTQTTGTTGTITNNSLHPSHRIQNKNLSMILNNQDNSTEIGYFFQNFRILFYRIIYHELISKLAVEIETNLRLSVHVKELSHMEELNPKKQRIKKITSFLRLNHPLRILSYYVNVKLEIEHYLNRTFYNLTTVALADWKTYNHMKSLAKEKYCLELMDNYLPMGSLEQGLDILQIMRNIHIFVSRFSYNMNNQEFIEFKLDKLHTSSKHINTIKIQSIAASIRQHGLGILNTTVNYTYQFLASKFRIFIQFLNDDYIKAYLSREIRWYKKQKNSLNNIYPYDKAFQFTRDIRKLGINDQQKTFLDQFRMLITEIGNALGYVRMVRSASMYYCSESVKFLPEFDDIVSFENCVGEGEITISLPIEHESYFGNQYNPNITSYTKTVPAAKLSQETSHAAKNLDTVIETLIKNFSEGSDYFKVLVNVFQTVLVSTEHEQLKNFYMIIPSMCISWMEASIAAKDNMHKVGSRSMTSKEMYFTDDGFAMGVAYCLAILKQTRRFEALHWNDSVSGKSKVDTQELKEQQAKRAEKEAKLMEQKKKDEKNRRGSFFGFGRKKEEENETTDMNYEEEEEIHTLQLTSKRLEAFKREADQLFYSLHGAQIFFKRTDNDT